MKIAKLTVENILRVSAVEIEPTGNVVVIGGKNGAGKSSVLRAIEMALAGKGVAPPRPVHGDAERGRIVVDLGDIQVERTFYAGKPSKLVVRSANGAVFPSPQALLDALVGRLTFDPLAFARAAPREQTEILRRLVGLDLSELEQKRAMLFARRTDERRQAEQASAASSDIPPLAEGVVVPDAEPDPGALVAELERRQRDNAARMATVSGVDKAHRERTWAAKNVSGTEAALAAAKRAVAEEEARLEAHTRELEAAEAAYDVAVRMRDEAMAAIEDEAAVRAELADVQRVSGLVRQEQRRATLIARSTRHAGIVRELTEQIEIIDHEKRKRVREAPFPVPGLSMDDDGAVTFGGLPFEQASSAEQLRTSVAIGCAANPKLRVMFVRDGSLLDDQGMELLAELAAAADTQIWVERVGRGDAAAFIIEDGEVAEQ